MTTQTLGRVVVVDDEEDLRNILVSTLTRNGYEAVGFATGAEALARLQTETFDILLSDLMMPGMDGLTLLKKSLEVDPNLMGLIMTGQGTVQTAIEALKTGAFDYVLKPFKVQALLPNLSRALQVRHLRLENLQLRDAVTIHELSQVVALTLDLPTIIEKTADASLQLWNADEASVVLLLVAPDETALEIVAVRGNGRQQMVGQRVPLDKGVAGWVAQQREPVVLSGPVQDPRFESLYPHPDIQASVSMPMLSGSRLVGVLNVNVLRRPRPFTPGQVKALSILANTAASAIENAQLHTRLREDEERFRALIENSSDAITLLNAEGQVIYDSPAAPGLLGYGPNTFIGQNVFEYVHPEDQVAVRALFGQLIQQEHSKQTTTLRFRHQNGEWRWLEAVASNLLTKPGVQAVVLNYRDVSERQQAAADIARRLAELEGINRVSTALRAAQSLDEMLPLLLKETLAVLGAGSGSIWLYDSAQELLVLAAHEGWGSDHVQSHKRGQGVPGHVLVTGEPYIANEIKSDPLTIEAVRQVIPAGLAGAYVPIRTSADVIGVLMVNVPASRQLTEIDIRLLTTLAEIGGNAIHRTRLHEQTEQRLRHLTALRAIDVAITGSLDLRLTLNVLLDQVVAQLGVDAADVLLLVPQAGLLEYVAGRGFRSSAIQRTRLRLGEGHAGRAAIERQLIRLPNLGDEDSTFVRADMIKSEGFQAYFAVPLIAKGVVSGVLELFHRAPHPGDADWLDFLESLAGQAAIAIDNAELFSDLQRSNSQLIIAYDATIEGWSRALDLRDKETEGHTQRVTEMTLRLAEAMGFKDEELIHIRRGALLHDIGKLGVPDNILLKPGPLTDEEWVIMRKHPQYAYDMLAPIAYLHPALDIPYCHHEEWDGTGYPRALKGEAIPLSACLFAVVDVWDALRSDRPYRQGWPAEKVREHIRAGSGTHFDPRTVEYFLKLLASSETIAAT